MAEDKRWQDLGDATKFLNLDGIEFREYQFNITKNILKGRNTLVVLPTGLGKTLIGAFAIARALSIGKKAMMLAPTKPLSEQHYATLRQLLKIDESKVLLLTGAMVKRKRAEMEEMASVIVATPQTVANDLKSGNLSLEGFDVVIFDECHKAVGKYAYTYIANECSMKGIQVIGLTASPGGKREKVSTLIDALNIQAIEARISTDEDVIKYVMPKYVSVVEVEKSEIVNKIGALLKPEIESSLEGLNKMGLINIRKFERIPKGRLIELGNLINKISARNFKFGALANYIKLLNLMHAYDLLETEGLAPFLYYFKGLAARENKGRAVSSLLDSKNVISAMQLAEEYIRNGVEHPKVDALLKEVRDRQGQKKGIIVFAQYRSTIKMLVDKLNAAGFNARAFVGKKEGVTQEQQKQTIADFREGKFDVLVASSIGEEGLDIPSVDLVVFYEPIPNEIRNIQRRGRTGRFRAGEIVILVAKDTKDQIYLYVSRQRERKMLAIISSINAKLEEKLKAAAGQQGLTGV
ncbi:MAG: DEAD/DEAH box helicase [Candidatus Micrarchaeia archaeon]